MKNKNDPQDIGLTKDLVKSTKAANGTHKVVQVEVLPAAADTEYSGDNQKENEVVGEGEVIELADTEVLVSELPPSELEIEQDPEISAPNKNSREIVSYDPLHAYLREMQRYPILSKEEEHELALKYYNEKDVQAAYKLISSNLWLVVKIARDYEKAVRSLLDIIQEGNIGLMEAVKNFDPYRGVRFPSYAVWWIKAYIIRYVIANWRLVKIGTTQAQRKLFFNLKKEKEKLEREGIFPAPKLLAEKLNVKESEISEMEQRLSGADMSVDAPIQDNPDNTLLSLLPSGAANAEDLLAHKQTIERLLENLDLFSSTLNHKELLIFKQRMLGEEKATLQDVSDQLAISRERVRQIENKIREKLKIFLTQKLGADIADFGIEQD